MSQSCFTCFLHGDRILCVEKNGRIKKHDEKVVRKFMHPIDDIKWTLWVFGTMEKCFNKNNLKEQKKVLIDFGYPVYKFTNLEFDTID